MEFLSAYGLFIAKTLTVLVAVAIGAALIFSAASRKQKNDQPQIEVEKLNGRFDEFQHTLRDAVLDEQQRKLAKKAEQKKQKAEKKAAKKAAKKDEASPVSAKSRVFVTDFDGDIKASDVDQLRDVVTAILTEATPEDEVVLRLESGGGMVHSYGLAASQLSRIRQAGVPLTVCVDKVAASGGYMMACVANQILAAPFAILGSIGVVAQIPNFHRLLKKSNIDYELYTAGEHKRTLTMFGENTEKGREKFVEELEDTHQLFKDYVAENRSIVNVSDVATGEVWFGRRALERQLIDEIKTSDEYLFEKSKSADVFLVSISHKTTLAERMGISVAAGVERAIERTLSKLSTRYMA